MTSAIRYITLYVGGVPVQVVEGGSLHLIYAGLGATSQPGPPVPGTQPDPFPQYVHDDEIAALLASATDPAVAALVNDSGSATSTALRAASVAALEGAGTVAPIGVWDFDKAPTVNGVALGSGGGGAVADLTKALGILYAGLATRIIAPCRVVFLGSSTTAGGNASVPANRYVNRLVTAVQGAYPSGLGTEAAVLNSDRANFGTPSAAAGVHGYNAGESGTSAANYLLSDKVTRIGALNPRAVFHMVGSNDYAAGVAPATYRAQVESALDALDAQIAGPCVHVLVHSYQRLDVTNPAHSWAAYGDQCRAIAAARPDTVAFLDLTPQYEPVGIPGGDPLDLLDTDNIHQTDAGHAFMADLLRRALAVMPAAPAPAVPTVTLASDDFTRADAATLGITPVGGKTWTTWGGATFGISAQHAVVTAGGGSATIDVGTGDYDVSLDITHGAASANLGITFALTDNSNRMAFYVDHGAASLNLVKLDAGNVVSLGGGGIAHPVVDGQTHTMRVVKKGAVITCYRNGIQTHTHTLDAGEQTKYGAVSTVGIRHSAVGGYTDNFIVKTA